MKKIISLSILIVLAFAGPSLAISFQKDFDYLGPQMLSFTNSKGRNLTYIDVGNKEWPVVVFFGGAGTSVQAFYLTEFARTLRNDLKLRIVSLERNGFGQTEYLSNQTYTDYVQDLTELLDNLQIKHFKTVAISGGGPFMASFVEAHPDQVDSLHFAAAFSYAEVAPLSSCIGLKKNPKEYRKTLTGWITNPMVWWDLGANTSINKIPGFQDTANNEGAHSFFIRGQMGDSNPAFHEYSLLCSVKAPEGSSKISAPVYLYYGEADKSVDPKHADFFEKRYTNSKKITKRLYPGEGHDVQYRHWDQILLDIAGYGDKLLVCEKGKASLIKPEKADEKIANQKAILGLCAWE